MLHTMVRAFTQKKSVLPFGCNLTKIFRYHEVHIEGEIGTKLKKEDTYNKSTLNRMGWKKQEGVWTYCPKSDQTQRINREQQEDLPPWEAQESGQEVAPSRPRSHTRGSTSTSEYRLLVEVMSSRFDALNVRFDSMEASIDDKFKSLNSRLDHLEKDHKTIRTDFEIVEDTIYYDLHVTKRRLKRLERKLAESKTIDKCEETSGDESAQDDPPVFDS
ncbi:hypothetical protein CFOL_v3_18730 [Cephalotus follicularis]|uniref:Uncharacterized protein n=1 Tax=Cephalotus follicularis TaxID=3775 RepID=A0A1Q3C559_CEPFO|nr:hypothetical protein CFOL_v3_18730 [Cephalotus follicularis]